MFILTIVATINLPSGSPIYLDFFDSLVTEAEYKTEVISEIIDFHTANQFSNKKIVTYFKISDTNESKA